MNWARFIELAAVATLWGMTWALSYSVINLIVTALGQQTNTGDEVILGFMMPVFIFGVLKFVYFDKQTD